MRVVVDSEMTVAAPVSDDPAIGPLRTCLATGETRSPDGMIRFVVGPDARLVPDLARKLPGRGLWVTATRTAVSRAIARKAFARAARQAVVVDADLPDRLERLLRERALESLALARRAGMAVNGFAKVEERLRSGRLGLAVCAKEAHASDGRAKLIDRGAMLVDFVDAAVLGRVFGREDATYIGIAAGPVARRVAADIGRWAAYDAAGEQVGVS
ncbi:MAG: RNA-binding protein [Alphaproteobacteria bacterium]|nr:RNA-binding protein [Alphaproteobacteria bacterium]